MVFMGKTELSFYLVSNITRWSIVCNKLAETTSWKPSGAFFSVSMLLEMVTKRIPLVRLIYNNDCFVMLAFQKFKMTHRKSKVWRCCFGEEILESHIFMFISVPQSSTPGIKVKIKPFYIWLHVVHASGINRLCFVLLLLFSDQSAFVSYLWPFGRSMPRRISFLMPRENWRAPRLMPKYGETRNPKSKKLMDLRNIFPNVFLQI